MKKLLVICSHFPPSYNVGANRPRWFARHLPPLGWQPYFITSPRRDRDGPAPREPSDIPTAPVIRIPSRIFWKPLAVFHAVRCVRREKIDIIYSTSPNTTVHFIGWATGCLTGVPWICEFRDPWTLQWVFRNPLRKIWHRFLERQCVRRADHVVTVGQVLKSQFAQRGGLPDSKVSVVFNGYEKLVDAAGEDAPPDEAASGRILRIGYFGTVNLFSSPLPFLRALGTLLRRRPDLRGRIRFDFFGYFKSAPDLKRRWTEVIKEFDLDAVVKWHGELSRDEAMLRLRRSQWLLLVVGGPAGTPELYRSRVPAKLFDCLALQKSVLTIAPLNGEAAELVHATECGVVVPFDDLDAIAEVIEKAADEPPVRRQRTRQAQEAVDRLAIQWQLKQLSIVLNKVRMSRSRAPVGAAWKRRSLGALFFLGGLLYAPWKAWRRRQLNQTPPKSVLILASHSGVGNTILLLPMLSALKSRRPAMRLAVLVRSAASAELLRAQPYVDEVIHLPLDAGASFRREIPLLRRLLAGEAPFDCAVSTFLEPHEENSLRALLSGAGYRMSFCRNVFGALDTLTLKADPERHEIDNHMLIARELGAEDRNLPRVVVPAGHGLKADRILEEQGLAGLPLVGVHAGSDAVTAAKRWPLDQFIAVAKEVRRGRPDVQFLFFFGPHEKALRESLQRREPPGLHAAPDLPLMDVAGLISRCDVFLSNDSGLMHLAAALAVPTVAIFGPTIPSKNAPAGDLHVVIRQALPCSPCYDGRFVRDNGGGTVFEPPCDGSIDCLANLPVDRVAAEIDQRLPKRAEPVPVEGGAHVHA